MTSKIIALVGPTASGKTTIGIELAKKLNGEIISADSRQIYKYLDIGTNKEGKYKNGVRVFKGIKQHLTDIINPDKIFSAGDFVKLAQKKVDEILTKGKQPIIVGGTGLYIKSLINGIAPLPHRNDTLRKQLVSYSKELLYRELVKVDPESASRIHPNNLPRIIRALEVYKLTGIPISIWHKKHKLQVEEGKKNNYLLFGFLWPRNELNKRIASRVDKMLKLNLIQETKQVLEMGYKETCPGLQSIGYKWVIKFLHSEIDYNEMVRLIVRDTQQYAKRQMTWFRKDKRIIWIDCAKEFLPEKIVAELLKYIF